MKEKPGLIFESTLFRSVKAWRRQLKFAEAIAELETARRLAGPYATEAEAFLGRTYADAGDSAAARKVLAHLQEWSRDHFLSAAHVATIHIGLGEMDEAIAALTEAAAQRSYLAGFWRVDPDVDPVRTDPRFIALTKQAGIAP